MTKLFIQLYLLLILGLSPLFSGAELFDSISILPQISEEDMRVLAQEGEDIDTKSQAIHHLIREIYGFSGDSESESIEQIITQQLNLCHVENNFPLDRNLASELGPNCYDILNQGFSKGLSFFQMSQAVSRSVWGDDSLWTQFPENKLRYHYLLSNLEALYAQEARPLNSIAIQNQTLENLIYHVRDACFFQALTTEETEDIFSCRDLISYAKEEGLSYAEVQFALSTVKTSIKTQLADQPELLAILDEQPEQAPETAPAEVAASADESPEQKP